MLHAGGYFAGHETPSRSRFETFCISLGLDFEAHQTLREKMTLLYVTFPAFELHCGGVLQWLGTGATLLRNVKDPTVHQF